MTGVRLIVFLSVFPALASAADGDAAALWTGRIQPLFDVNCVKCHGPIEQKGELELDTPEAVHKGGDNGAVVVPGKPEESPLYQHLAPEADPHMPPKKQLTDAEREMVREWIIALGNGPAAAPAVPEPAAPLTFPDIPAAVEHWLTAGWQERGVTPAAAADDRTWCRRIWLDLAGRTPTTAELEAFLYAPEPDKRARLADQLLASPEYAVRMRELWDAFLMGRGKRGSSEDRRRNAGWWTWLEDRFASNQPWPDTVRCLLSGRDEKKGASWFLYERRNENQAIAEAVAPLIYGTKIDCAQCHDHPLAREIKQAHYWGLVAAYNRSKNVDGGIGVAESAIGGDMNFTNLKKESQAALVTLLTGHTVSEPAPGAGGEKPEDKPDLYVDPDAKVRVPKFSRRGAFAEAATADNPLLARAFVNRMWAALTGRGIVHPADEMNARNVPSHPALLDWLAQDFAASGGDVKRFVRGIVLSRVYALDRTRPDAPPEAFTGIAERPLTAEQVARSWRVAAGFPPDEDGLRKAVITALPDVLPKEPQASFQQALFLTSSPALTGLLQPAEGNTTARLAALTDNTELVRSAFLTTLGRLPDADEAAQTAAFLSGRPDRAAAVRDLLWALLTGAEFLTAP